MENICNIVLQSRKNVFYFLMNLKFKEHFSYTFQKMSLKSLSMYFNAWGFTMRETRKKNYPEYIIHLDNFF